MQQNCTVTATTGKASFNINGITIHSLLNLPVGARENTDLKGQALVRFQDKLQNIKYILIDEYSMQIAMQIARKKANRGGASQIQEHTY